MTQILLVLLIDDTLGSSTSYCTVLTQLIPSSLSKTSMLRYFDNVVNNMESWWQVAIPFIVVMTCNVWVVMVTVVALWRQIILVRPHNKRFILLLQVIFMAGYMTASYASSNLSGSYGNVDGVSISNAFIGGFLLLFGARLASGCTRYLIIN